MNKCIEEKTGRLRYFDALRGFSMIFVVFSHVVLFSMGLTDVKDSTVNWVIMTFRMPLFFFCQRLLRLQGLHEMDRLPCG